MGEVVQFVPRPNPDRFAKAHEQVRFELSSLVPFAKSGGPPEFVAIDPSEWARRCQDVTAYGNDCSEINPDCA